MIPQRNISLLSNRLAASGGRRIREDVLERDYCMARFLAGLSQSDLRGILGFKGSKKIGTDDQALGVVFGYDSFEMRNRTHE